MNNSNKNQNSKKKKKKKPVKHVSFMDKGDGEIVELIGEAGIKSFLIYDVLNEKMEMADKLEIEGIIYKPPEDNLTESGTLLLPTYPEEYDNIGTLIQLIDEFIYKYLDITDYYRRLASYYVVLTWIHDNYEVLPYLRALGDYGTGKTRFQKVIGSLCYKPIFAGGATTPSPIFRIIDIYKGTLIIDEADFRFSDAHAEIIKILNCGYTKGIPVLRSEPRGRKWIPTSYDVYGAKIIATRKRFDDKALESRCLTEIMTRTPRKSIPLILPKEFRNEALRIRNLLLMFRLRNYGQTEVDMTQVIPNIEPRINQIILPILSIVEDDKMKKEIVEFVTQYAEQLKTDRGEELPAEILRTMVEMVQNEETLKYKDITAKLNADKDKEQGDPIVSPAKLGKINSSQFNFKKRQVNGVYEMLWDKEKAKNLCERYGIEYEIDSEKDKKVDDVDKVDLFGEDTDNPPVSLG